MQKTADRKTADQATADQATAVDVEDVREQAEPERAPAKRPRPKQPEPVIDDTAPQPSGPSRRRLAAAAVALTLGAGALGWFGPQLVAQVTKPAYLGQPAFAVATDLGCTEYNQAAKHDESVYRYHDQGTCVLDDTVVTITTFARASDGQAFESVMRAVIPVLHPTWSGAAYASGEGWNVADARNLTPEAAQLAVSRLGEGTVHIIPSAKRAD